jgi:hypothetical protein
MADLSTITKQLITERDHLNAAIAALESVSNGASRKGLSTKRTLSASARARIAAAQRKRWAKVRAKKSK